jgi:uncharacterized coiled-coil protein SlyX
MTKLQELEARFREQAVEMTNLSTAIDVQFKRIAQIQAELDALPQARRRRLALLAQPPSHSGNGRGDRK